MAFTLEDGTGVEGANAYTTAAEVRAYWLDRGVAVAQTDAQVEAAIIVSSQYVDFNNAFKGVRVNFNQGLSWPRRGVEGISPGVVPVQVRNAVAEYATRQLAAPLQPDVDPLAVKRKRVKADIVESEIEYQDGAGYFGVKSYPLADGYLRGLTTSQGLGKIGC